MMTNLLNGAHVANKLFSTIARLRLLLVMFLTLTASSAWGATYNFSNIPTTGWKTNGGSQTINGKSWTYSSATYVGCSDNAKIQIGSKNNPQTSNWTIQIPISSFGANIKVTKVAITAYTTATTATYDISVNGSSVKSGNLTTSSATYSSNTLNATTGSIVVTLKGSSSSKAMYLSNIAVTYETAAAHTVTWTINPAAGGSLSPTSGNTTTVTPDAAYTYGSPAYTVTSGSASVYQNGNTFTATPTANSTIQINMVEKPKYTVKFYKTSTTFESVTEASVGAGVAPPTMEQECGDWTFQGWSESPSNSETSTTELELVTLTGGKYYPTKDVNLYPVYTKTTSTGGTAFDKYTQVSLGGTITSGKYLISTGSYTMAGNGKTGASFSPGSTEKTEYEYTITIDGSFFTILGPDDNYVGGANSTTLQFGTTATTDSYLWNYDDAGIQNKSYTTRRIRANGTSDFRHYANTNGTTTYLYKRTEKSSGSTYYYSYPQCTTQPSRCLIPKS